MAVKGNLMPDFEQLLGHLNGLVVNGAPSCQRQDVKIMRLSFVEIED